MLIVFFILISIGLYLILADKFKIATLKKSKYLVNINKVDKKKNTKSLDVLLLEQASRIDKYIQLDEYKRDRLAMNLKSAHISISPETYIADVYLKTGIVLILAIPSFFISSVISIFFLVIAVVVYYITYNRVNEILKKNKNSIEIELPRFAMTIEQELSLTRDIVDILERYRKNSNSKLGHELEITLADMRSGSYEEALKRFEMRIGSSSLSEIIRGLIGILNGNDETEYFKMLSKDLRDLEYQRLRGIALKRPSKVKKYSAAMLFCLMLIYGVVLFYQIINGLSGVL